MTQVKYGYDTIHNMTTTATTDEQWLSSPLVQYAINQAGTGADEITVLATLVDLMNELEDRCPGVPFASILAGSRFGATQVEKRESALHLLSMGMDEAVITEMLDIKTDVQLMFNSGLRTRTEDPAKAFMADRVAGLTVKQIGQKWGVTPRTVFRYLGAPKRAVAALVAS